jgi:L-lactate dehydrogenase
MEGRSYMPITKRSVGIVGLGRIGSRCAYSLALSGTADALVLYDIDEKRVKSEASDIGDAVAYMTHRVSVTAGEYAELARCDIVVMAAGIFSDSKDRLSLLEGNLRIADEIVDNLMKHGFDGILIVITNPCDVLAFRAAQRTGLPGGRIFSTGTALDSARLVKQLSLATGIDHKSISALVMGEHGASQVIPWSAVTIYGQTLETLAAADARFRVSRDDICEKVLNGAWTAVDGKGVAEYGVAAALIRCVGAIFHDEKAVIPVSTSLRGEYGVTDVFAGVPAVLGANGVEGVIELKLTDHELADFRASCDTLKKAMDTL